ncbi:hypothetical protein NM680_13010 [Paracoccus sp. PS-1]|uniref:hypothetical protein n=1 Tax=Paracoccus sp. PS1 TaxID=2963938 RepID=UPI0027E4F747|nr:hypothetical protein [Paracoccus sp. PS1]MDQ7262712.1 hypothetical protein [Paracoccus sp. PS1]
MSDEPQPTFGPLVDEELKQVAFSGPAVHGDRVVVTESGGIVRVAVMEDMFGAGLAFRGAVAMSLGTASDLSGMLAKVVENAKVQQDANVEE